MEYLMPEKAFGQFYLESIALSEGCGCAEKFIGTRGIDPQAPMMPASLTRSRQGFAVLSKLVPFIRSHLCGFST